MIGGNNLAHTILGIDYNQQTGACVRACAQHRVDEPCLLDWCVPLLHAHTDVALNQSMPYHIRPGMLPYSTSCFHVYLKPAKDFDCNCHPKDTCRLSYLTGTRLAVCMVAFRRGQVSDSGPALHWCRESKVAST